MYALFLIVARQGADELHADLYQYLFPIAVPVLVVALCAPLLLGAAAKVDLSSNSALDSLTPVDYEQPLPPLMDIDTDLDTSLAVDEADVDAEAVEDDIDRDAAVREDLEPESLEVVQPSVGIQGGRWDEELHAAVNPECSHDLATTTYTGATRTGFVSFPRSGNSYLRSLVERATGYQTSSICELPSVGVEGRELMVCSDRLRQRLAANVLGRVRSQDSVLRQGTSLVVFSRSS